MQRIELTKYFSHVVVALAAVSCAGQGASDQETLWPPPQPTPVEATEPAEPIARPEAKPPALPPSLRLSTDVVTPTRHRVELVLDPGKDGFSGAIEIDVAIAKPTDHIWLHATEIELKTASITMNGETWPVSRLDTSNVDFLGLDLTRQVPTGAATLRIEYTGAISQKDQSGLFRQKDSDHWYLYTHFEATAARRAFPCFDEPNFKVPWQVTLHAPTGQLALTNTPVVESTPSKHQGMTMHRFAQTKPLPSYLVAMAVGPFEAVDLGKIGRNKTPSRIIVPRGHTARARYAADATPKLLALLEDYFDMPYPYAKLDQIALPQFFGAMENPGLITYGFQIILDEPGKERMRFKRVFASVGAHELAHQWFGNLVTLAWWNDIWLNESFATWMGDKAVDQWQPGWNGGVTRVNEAEGAMSADSLATARMIRQPIRTKHDISDAFDAISYNKGGAVLSMFERWIGEQQFKAGVRAYLKKHAWGVTTAEDFLAALGGASEKRVTDAFRTFLEQPGVPLLNASLTCEKGNQPALKLTQERMLPTGSKGSTHQTWQIPMCVKYGKGKRIGHTCAMLDQQAQTVALDKATSCPDWVQVNDDAAGYYRVAYEGGLLARLLGAGNRHLTVPERVRVVGDMRALVTTGKVPLGEALSLVPRLLKDKNPHVIRRTAGVVAGISRDLIPNKLRPNYQRFVRKMFGKQARKLGWKGRKSDSDDTVMLRRSLVRLVVTAGRDPVLTRRAIALARTWLKTRKGLDREMRGTILGIAVLYGDDALYDQFVALLKQTKDPEQRRVLMQAVAQTDKPARIKQNLQLFLSDEFSLRESAPLFQFAVFNPDTREIAYEWLKQNYDAVSAKMPRMARSFLIYSASGFCDDAHHKDAKEFFGPKAEGLPGGPKALAQTLERIELCIAFRAAQQPSVEKFLQKH